MPKFSCPNCSHEFTAEVTVRGAKASNGRPGRPRGYVMPETKAQHQAVLRVMRSNGKITTTEKVWKDPRVRKIVMASSKKRISEASYRARVSGLLSRMAKAGLINRLASGVYSRAS